MSEATAAPKRVDMDRPANERPLALRLLIAMCAGAAIGAVVGAAAGIAPFAALVGAPIGMAGAVLVGE